MPAPKTSGKRRGQHRQRTSNIALNEKALQEIRERILSGQIPGGYHLSEQRLSKDLALTRGPVRQALMRLEREGLVVIVPRRWTQVRTVEPQEFKATLALRFGIETIVVCELARRKPHQTDLSDLKRICGEMNSIASREAELSDTEKTTFVDLDVQFHTQMAILAGYGPAVDFLRNAGNITCLFSNQLKRMQIISDPDTKFLNDIVKEHSAILLAIESRDPLEARKSLHKHLCSAGRRWQTSVESASMSYLEDDVPSYFKDFPTMIL